MANLLNLAMAAKMAGVSRRDVQQQIREGKLHTFEGMIRVAELVRVYPNAQLENTEMLTFVAEVKRNAVNKLNEVDPERLVQQIGELRRMLAQEHQMNVTYLHIINGLKTRLLDMQSQCDKKDKAMLEAMMAWLGSQMDENTIEV